MLQLQFNPIMQGRAEEVKDKLCTLADCLLIEFVGKDLIEIV